MNTYGERVKVPSCGAAQGPASGGGREGGPAG